MNISDVEEDRKGLLPVPHAPAPPPASSPATPNSLYKSLALVVLVLQNSALALCMRYSRVTSQGPLYLASTAVVLSEYLKLGVSSLLVLREEGSAPQALARLRHEILGKPQEMGKLLVPSVLYVCQNNLAYVAVSNLDAGTYQVLYQLKILTTALFSIFLLRRRLETLQWLSLVLLVGGVSLVQLSGQQQQQQSTQDNNPMLGLVCILLACCSSGFAGVYFEKVLKSSSDVSVWVRNVQLALIGTVMGLAGVWCKDATAVRAHGFFYGYSPIVWTVISLQALGGIVVALVVKYADSLLKGFSTSVSIVLSCVLSSVLFRDMALSFQFVCGTLLVIFSTILYSSGGGSKAPATPSTTTPSSILPASPSFSLYPYLPAAMSHAILEMLVLLQGRDEDKQMDDKNLSFSSSSAAASMGGAGGACLSPPRRRMTGTVAAMV